jgi:hypothetical protein
MRVSRKGEMRKDYIEYVRMNSAAMAQPHRCLTIYDRTSLVDPCPIG